MGFRSTFVTGHYNVDWPVWFREKYRDIVFFNEGGGVIASRCEAKTYQTWDAAFLSDIQKAILEGDFWNDENDDFEFSMVFLHECGGVTKYAIRPKSIQAMEPRSWEQTEGVTHSYCYGCSDPGDMSPVEEANVRADGAEIERRHFVEQNIRLRANFQMEVNAKVREFIDRWLKTEAAKEARPDREKTDADCSRVPPSVGEAREDDPRPSA